MITTHTGTIAELGAWNSHDGRTKVYTHIEIKNQIVKNVVVTSFLDNFLIKALHHDGDVVIETFQHSSMDTFKRFLFWFGGYAALSAFFWFGVSTPFFHQRADHLMCGLFTLSCWLPALYFWLAWRIRVPIVKSITIDGTRYTD